MHAIVYNLFNFKDLYVDVLSSAIEELKKNENHIIYLVWSYDDPKAFEDILNQFKEILSTDRLILITGSNLSFAQSRNLGLFSAKNSTFPFRYITFFEDDHFYYHQDLDHLELLMDKYWGKKVLGNLKVGMFSYCIEHRKTDLIEIENNVFIPKISDESINISAINSCMRSAPIQQFIIHAGNYELDEYPISTYQTNAQNIKNYNKGYTTLFLDLKKISSHRDSDIPENSFGIQKRNIRFFPNYSKSHYELITKHDLIQKQKNIPFKLLVKLIINKIIKKIK